MFMRLLLLLRSKGGFTVALMGALILFGLLIYGLVSVLGHVEVIVKYIGPVVYFLGTGPGVLLSVAVAVLLILWALRPPRPKRKPGHAAPAFKPDREYERLKSDLQESEREQERLQVALQEGERERERLKSDLQQSKQERKRLQAENKRLKAERDELKRKTTVYDNRVILKQALNAAYWEGLHLRGRKPSEDEAAAKKWAIRTNELIKGALGESEARRFLATNGYRSGDSSATEEQKQLDRRLNRLSELIQRVDSLQPLDLRPDFEGQEWINLR
jgi:hypothetical protein